MKFKKLSALILGAILTVGIAAGVGAKVEDVRVEAASGDTYSFSTAESTTGTSTDKIWEFSTAKNNGTSAPAYNSSDKELRLYYNSGGNGCSLTIKLTSDNESNYKLTKIEYTASSTSYTPSIKFFESTSATGNSSNGTWSSTTATYENANGFKALTIQNANTTNKQLRLKSVKVYYELATSKEVSSIDVSLIEPSKDWYVGDEVKTTDLNVKVNYTSGDPLDVTNGEGVEITSGSPLTSVGVNTINVSYTDAFGSATDSCEVIAQAQRTLEGVTLKGDMTKKEYNVGDAWDLSGLYLDLSYSSGENEEIQLTDLINGTDYLLDPETADKTSISEIYIAGTYKGCDFDGTITGISVSQITYDVLNRSLTGVEGTGYSDWSDKISNTGVVYAGQSAGGNDSIQLRSNNNNSGIISTENNTSMLIDKVVVTWQSGTSSGRTLDVYGNNSAYSAPTDLYSTSTQGTKLGSITCGTSTELKIEGDYSYIGLRSNSGAMYLTEVQIYYKEAVKKTVTSLEVTTNPNKLIYSAGEDFNPEGMVVTATYSDLSTEDVTASCTFSPSVIANDTNEITISYTYEGDTTTCTLPITLKAVKNVTGIASMPNVYVGDTVDASQFELNVEYNDDTTGTVQADEVNLDTTTAGVKEAAATYNGASNTKTITFEVEVYGLTSLSWTKRGEHVAFAGSTLGEAFNTTEWEFTAKYNDENKTQLEPSPVFGTGENDVHIALYDVRNPKTENTPLTSDYVFTLEDDGKFLVASYKGIFSSANNPIDVVERLNAINKEETVEAEGASITFELGANGEASHNDGSEKETYSETVDGKVLEITSGTKMYTGARDLKGNSCIKLGTSKVAGGFTLSVPNDVISVTIHAGKYKTNTSKLSINGTEYTLTGNSDDGSYDAIEVDTSTNKTITLTTVSGGYRAMINTIVFTASGGEEVTTINYANNNLKAQAAVMEFVNFFNTTMRADGACGDGNNVDYNSDSFVTAWNAVSEKYAELITNNANLTASEKEHANNMLVYATPYWTNEFNEADPLQEAMRTYDKVVSNSELAKFITGRPKVEDNSVGLLGIVQENSSMTIVIIALAALSAFAFVYVAKRKQRKIEL